MPAADTSARFLMQMIIADDFKSAYTDPYNKARGDIAYTLLDFNDEVPAHIAEDMTRLEQVIRVRLIH